MTRFIHRNSRCGETGLVVSLECWDAGLIHPGHNELRIRCCCSFGVGHNCGSDLTPGLGTPYATGRPRKEKEKKKKRFIHKSCFNQDHDDLKNACVVLKVTIYI